MLALGQRPDDPEALAVLALSRVDQGKGKDALESAREAIGIDPTEPFLHYVHAHVLRTLERPDEAYRAVKESLRLNPLNADAFALLSSIELARRRWDDALDAAEFALAINPEHVGGANLRAMALVRLGRKDEAMQSVDYALGRAPENAFSHANQGWNCLHQNNPRRAQEHFQEALRLDPNLEFARDGMLEALKARNPVYRAMLAYYLWLGRQSSLFQWGCVIGIYVAGRTTHSLSNSLPEWKWLWWPLLGFFYAFVYLSWTAHPMFNLLLRFNRFGRHVLTADQRTGANWFGAAFAGMLGSLAWWFATKSDAALFSAIALAILSVCVSATFIRTGRDRIILGSSTALLAVVAMMATYLTISTTVVNNLFSTAFAFGFLGFQILANMLASRTN